MPRGFSERERAAIRDRLLERGRELLERYGMRKTSVEDLARAAGISKGAFYLFYGSKEELFFEVLERFEAGFRAGLLERARRSSAPPRERLRELLRVAVITWKESPLFREFGTAEYAQLLGRIPEERLAEHLRRDETLTAELLDAAGVRGAVDPRRATGLMRALFFVSLHEGDFEEGVYPATLEVLTDLVAGHLAGAEEER